MSEHTWRSHYAIGCGSEDCPICIENDLDWCDICGCWVEDRKLRIP